MTPASTSARDWIADSVTLIIDNDQTWHDALLPDVVAVLADAFDADGQALYSDWELADLAGLAVRDFLADRVEQALPVADGPLRLLVTQLLDFADREQWAMIGDRYVGSARAVMEEARDS